MRKTSQSQNDWISAILFVVTIFMSAGWYFAEQDNEILLQELESQNYTKPAHHEGK